MKSALLMLLSIAFAIIALATVMCAEHVAANGDMLHGYDLLAGAYALLALTFATFAYALYSITH